MGRVWGLPYRTFICVMGLTLTTLSSTGVVIWYKKRRARLRRVARKQHQHAAIGSLTTEAEIDIDP